jgi:hypothetical protein
LLLYVKERSRFAPFAGGDLPNLTGEAAGDEVSLFGGDDPHAGLLGDAARGEISDGLWSAKDRETEAVKPEVIDGNDRLGHKALSMPREAKPEAAIVGTSFMQADGADVVLGRLLQSQRPLPFVAAFDSGERNVAVIGESTVFGVGPGNIWVEMLHDLPLRKEALGLLRVGELERAQEEAPGEKFDGGNAGRHGRNYNSGGEVELCDDSLQRIK